MQIEGKVAVVTGAASGIGRATSRELCNRGAAAIALIDMSDAVHEVAEELSAHNGTRLIRAFQGDTTDSELRNNVFKTMRKEIGIVNIVVPAAGITRDALSVKINRDRGKANIYPIENFRQVVEVNLIAPVYWALEMVAQVAEDRFSRGLKQWQPEEGSQAVAVFIGSISSQGNKGQISYAATKVGLEGAAATLMKEGMHYGVRCAVLHPGFTDTPMVRALGDDYIDNHVIPATQIKRLIRPEEIADAICFLITNSAVSGQLWADAGWHPMP
ncbi:MAG: SDR family NAD(P)-dependent oxidoreductase [Pseudomonadota bacterium]